MIMPSHIYIRTGDNNKGIITNDLAVNGFNNSVRAFAPIAGGRGLYRHHNIRLKKTVPKWEGAIGSQMRLQGKLRQVLAKLICK